MDNFSYADTPAARYTRDPQFRYLVNALECAIHQCRYSPSELREAALLASIRYESYQVRAPHIAGLG